MRPFRVRTIRLLGLLALVVIALRPVLELERALDYVVLPARLLAELSAPVGWMAEVRAAAPGTAGDSLAQRFDLERRGHDELERAVLSSALPDAVPLAPDVLGIHAEVVGRRDLDTIRVRVESHRGLLPGLPVVSGDWFVGVVDRVQGLAAGGEELLVQLITDSDARVGARIDGDQEGLECQLVVGGITARADAVRLDVHNPSRRTSVAGEVRVHEPAQWAALEGAGGHAALANGFRLGRLELDRVEEHSVLGVLPGLDYEAGLFQVLVLCPEGLAEREREVRPDPLDDPRWLAARLLATGEPSAWREGRELALGRRSGVHDGAAVAHGTRLVGRVRRAGLISSDVSLLGDPGLALSALAMVEAHGAARPWVLGALRGRGRDESGRPCFEWAATLPLPDAWFTDPGKGLRATVWSGSGEVGMPRGLLLGSTVLPAGAGPHELVLEEPEGSSVARDTGLRVRWSEGPEDTP